MTNSKGKIGVLIEDHFDPTEYRRFNEYFPSQGYEVEYLSHLWGQPELHFGSNPENNVVEERVTVRVEVNDIDPSDYAGIILIGAYATDRLRYQVKVKKGQKNQAPAVVFLRKAMEQQAKVGTICHSMWLLCADSDLLKGRKVTCAHNIVCDVENAGGEVIYTEDDETADLVIDGNLISGKHPGMVDEFMVAFVQEIEKN
ncbi:MAG TPA: DJ-1/PfpI family protein [Anaerolineae bacterium]|nr:DJ-1/PfpI family protein [Anaerolineae bacterium]HMR64056.1 DJ-1/PfpI family protein [Anaerolineae bacterium]